MNLKKSILIAFPVLAFAAGFLTHRYLVRRVHDIRTTAENFSYIGMGGAHGQPFTTDAFEVIQSEADSLLRQVVPEPRRYIYIVASPGGFDIYMHSSPDVPPLTEQQTLQFRDLVWQRMRALSVPPTPSSQ
jgi:hypothetical protein